MPAAPLADAALLPGLRFEVRQPLPEAQPLRTDIAGFIGLAERGPVGTPMRLDSWRAYGEMFGERTADADMAFAVQGYFENGGEVAYVARLAAEPLVYATAKWTVGAVGGGKWLPSAPAAGDFGAAVFTVRARTPGSWANGLRVQARYRLRGPSRRAEVDLEITPPHGPGEYLIGLPSDDLIKAVAQASRFIVLEVATAAPQRVPGDPAGPLAVVWPPIELGGGDSGEPGAEDYAAGAEALAGAREVALMAMPDLDRMRGDAAARRRIEGLLIGLAEQRHDRQVIGALPGGLSDLSEIAGWLDDLRDAAGGDPVRSLALYHPWLVVPDPDAGRSLPRRLPIRRIAPVGHVAGAISRLDRERGAHHSPANAELYQAVDIEPRLDAERLGALAKAGVNPLLCTTGHGIMVWGARTAARRTADAGPQFLAHRRLIHRLVRAMRRVAEPLVFETAGPDLWLAIVRAITSLLLDAWNAGALKGDVPDEAFAVVCDASNNPPEDADSGQVLCEVRLAPAVPMEFITLRIAITREGRLEAIEG